MCLKNNALSTSSKLTEQPFHLCIIQRRTLLDHFLIGQACWFPQPEHKRVSSGWNSRARSSGAPKPCSQLEKIGPLRIACQQPPLLDNFPELPQFACVTIPHWNGCSDLEPDLDISASGSRPPTGCWANRSGRKRISTIATPEHVATCTKESANPKLKAKDSKQTASPNLKTK